MCKAIEDMRKASRIEGRLELLAKESDEGLITKRDSSQTVRME